MSDPEDRGPRFDFARLSDHIHRRSSHDVPPRFRNKTAPMPSSISLPNEKAENRDAKESIQTSMDDTMLFSENGGMSEDGSIAIKSLNVDAAIFTPRVSSKPLLMPMERGVSQESAMDVILTALKAGPAKTEPPEAQVEGGDVSFQGKMGGALESDHEAKNGKGQANGCGSETLKGGDSSTERDGSFVSGDLAKEDQVRIAQLESHGEQKTKVPLDVDESVNEDRSGTQTADEGADSVSAGTIPNKADTSAMGNAIDPIPPTSALEHPLFAHPFILDRTLDMLAGDSSGSPFIFVPLLTVNQIMFVKAAERIYAKVDPPMGWKERVCEEELEGTCLYRIMMKAGASYSRTSFYASPVKDLTVRVIVRSFDYGQLNYFFHLYPNCTQFTYSLQAAQEDRLGVIMTFNRTAGTAKILDVELVCCCNLDELDRRNMQKILEDRDSSVGLGVPWQIAVLDIPPEFRSPTQNLSFALAMPSLQTSAIHTLKIPGTRIVAQDLRAVQISCPALTSLTYALATSLNDLDEARTYLDELGALWPNLKHLEMRASPGTAFRIPLDEALKILSWRCPKLAELCMPMDPSVGVDQPASFTTVFFHFSPPIPKLPQYSRLRLDLCEFTEAGVTALEYNAKLMSLLSEWCDVMAVARRHSGSVESKVATSMYAKELNQGRKAALSHWKKPTGCVGWRCGA